MEILNNSTLQTILGAFLGALLGWLFSLISSNPQKEFRNLTIVETKIIIKNRNIKSNSKDDSNDPTMILFSLLGIFIFATFSYIKYYIQIFEYLKLYEFFVLFFILTTIFFTIINKNMTSNEWVTRLIIPIIIFIITILVFNYLEKNINQKLISSANNSKMWDFISSLTSYGRSFLLYQLISFLITLIVSILSLLSFINYFSLMNLRGNKGIRTWYYIHKYTKIGSGIFYYVLSFLLLIIVILIQSDWFKNTVLIN